MQLFLAGDGVQLVRATTSEAVQGVGTGSFAEHWSALRDSGVPIYLSGMSSKARGIDPSVASGDVELAAWADTSLTY